MGTSLAKLPLAAFAVLAIMATAPSSHSHGAYHDVLLRLDSQIAADPENAALWFERAELHLGHDEWMKSIQDCQKAENLSAGSYPTDWVKARALHAGGKSDAARRTLDRFLITNPDHAGALASRGMVLSKLGQAEAALADFRLALLKTDNPDMELILITSETMLACGHADEAADLLDKGVEMFGPTPTLLTKSLDTDLEAKRFAAALTRADALQASAPRPETWMARRASILCLAGQHEESQAAWSALKEHIASLPNLERGNAVIRDISESADRALAASPSPTGNPP